MPEFFFTMRMQDYGCSTRVMPGINLMIVASAHWRDGKFQVRRPPKTINCLAIDSGGFTAAARWGDYPFTPKEYVEWAKTISEGHELAFVAVMDYACERGVNRSVHATNLQRIKATVENTLRCFDAEPDFPWLPVIQGYTLDEYFTCIEMLEKEGLLRPTMGIGTLCTRRPSEAAKVIVAIGRRLPEVRFHAFGLDMRAITPETAYHLNSWDSYSWSWGAGTYNYGGLKHLRRRKGEGRSAHLRRMLEYYATRVALKQRLPAQLPLEV